MRGESPCMISLILMYLRGQAPFKNSESPQDFQLLNPHAPNQDLVVLSFDKKNPAVLSQKQLFSCNLHFYCYISLWNFTKG